MSRIEELTPQVAAACVEYEKAYNAFLAAKRAMEAAAAERDRLNRELQTEVDEGVNVAIRAIREN